MTDLSPRGNRRPSRRERESKAFRLVTVGGAASVVAVVGVILAILGVVSGAVPLLAAVVAAICFVLFRRMTS